MATKLQTIEESRSFLKQKNLKLKNQIAHLDCLMRKQESLKIEIGRLKKQIALTRKQTQDAFTESFASVFVENNKSLPYPFDDQELNDLRVDFNLLEEDFYTLLEEFSE